MVRACLAEGGEGLHDLDGFHGDAHDLTDQAHDVAGVVFTVRVGFALDLVLVDDPFERGARAEAIFEGLGRDAGERERWVYLDRLLVSAQLHFGDALGVGDAFGLDVFERPGFERFVVDVQAGEFAAGVGEGAEVGSEGDAGSSRLRLAA